MKVKVDVHDLEVIRDKALYEYTQVHPKGLSSEAFWGKCVLEASINILFQKGIDIEVEYPDKGYQVKD